MKQRGGEAHDLTIASTRKWGEISMQCNWRVPLSKLARGRRTLLSSMIMDEDAVEVCRVKI